MCHNLDFVAPEVVFTYKQKRRQGNILGGCISVLLILATVVSSLLFVIGVMMQPDYTTNIVSQYQAVDFDGPVVQKNGSFPVIKVKFFGPHNLTTTNASDYFLEYYNVL